MQRWPRPRSAAAGVLALLAAAACRGGLSRPPSQPTIRVETLPADTIPDTAIGDTAFPTMPGPGRPAGAGGALLRVALTNAGGAPLISATGRWRIAELDGSPLGSASAGEEWTVVAVRGGLRAERKADSWGATAASPLVVSALERGALLSFNGRRYRGELLLYATNGGVVTVNRVAVEDYLRGVVPLEIGERTPAERAAVEAQAVAARSYAYTHVGARGSHYDMLSTVEDQVYGGVEAERPLTDVAVAATAGLVLRYGGRIASAPYHSTCGGSTAEPAEIWNGESRSAYLRRVSDRIPGTDRYYCDPSPRFTWTREMTGDAVATALDRYLRGRAGSRGSVGRVRNVSVESRTPSGRVAVLVVDTDEGAQRLRGNEIRYALRGPGGDILNSTYFSVDVGAADESGAVSRVTIRGGGYGHGVGMCQWGAIGRARAGQDVRAILRTYYPGTSVGSVD
jgi:stage II sporulation protein D